MMIGIGGADYSHRNRLQPIPLIIGPIMSNVPSKLCACARAHKSWDERTQENV